ncbi:MAG TPA: 50S ribosomal protein L21 [Patescibacteria group bacterium]|nr:50S ribosomal protein L21 [Patescibacteria group bacterium]
MKYAVIAINGKQHVVSEGEKLTIDRLPQDVGEKLTIKDVLLVVDGEKRQIGTPLVEDAKVEAKLISDEKGDKIRVAVFKAKSRFRKVHGHRQSLSTIEITAIQ